MTKYIVKNCPACCNYAGKYSCENNHDEQGGDTYCENISDCLLKQIYLKNPLADDILNLLEIEEVNE